MESTSNVEVIETIIKRVAATRQEQIARGDYNGLYSNADIGALLEAMGETI